MRGESLMPNKPDGAFNGAFNGAFDSALKSVAMLLCTVCVLAAQQPDSAKKIAIKAAHMIDGRGGAPVNNAVILIQGDKITAVGSNLAIPAGTQVIDLGGST